MQKRLALGCIVLVCCLTALAQSNGYYQRSSGSSASGNLQKHDQGSSADPSYPSSYAEPSAMSANQSSRQKTTVQGCLTQSADGAFLLSDASGNTYQLNDNSSRLAQFVGKEIRVDGFGLFYSSSDAVPGSMAAGTGSLGPVQQIDVTKVRKIADKCQARSGSK